MGMMIRRNLKKRGVSTPLSSVEKTVNYKKTEINRMPIAELKEVAVKNNIKVAEGTTGTELKKAIIDKLNL
jgi:hypothetical protein